MLPSTDPNRFSRDVIVKLLGFTFAMIVIPIGSYFLTVNTIFQGMEMKILSHGGARGNIVLTLSQATQLGRVASRRSWQTLSFWDTSLWP